MIFLELWIGVAIRYRLARPNWVLRLPVGLVGELLLGGAFRFAHC